MTGNGNNVWGDGNTIKGCNNRESGYENTIIDDSSSLLKNFVVVLDGGDEEDGDVQFARELHAQFDREEGGDGEESKNEGRFSRPSREDVERDRLTEDE